MEIREKLFPYPVLSKNTGDYSSSIFDSEIEVSEEGDFMVLNLSTTLTNIELSNLIKSEQAEVVFHFECPKTAYRKIRRLKLNDYKEVISKDEVSGKLSICSFIVAKSDIDNYTSTNFNQEISGFMFDLEKGAILAVGKQVNLIVEKEDADLLNRSSIFSIIKNADSSNVTMLVELNEDKIIIKLPEQDFVNLNSLKNEAHLQSVINALIVLPTLIYVFTYILSFNFRDREDLEEKMWYRVIEKDLKQKFNIDINTTNFSSIEIMDISQKMINGPISRALKTIYEGYGLEEDDHYETSADN